MSAKLPPPEDRVPESEEALTVPEGFHDQKLPGSHDRDRRGLAAEVALDPGSLSGSYFYAEGRGWWGQVVGESQPKTYICEIDVKGGTNYQRLVPESWMITEGWDFYDTEEARTLAFAEALAKEGSET